MRDRGGVVVYFGARVRRIGDIPLPGENRIVAKRLQEHPLHRIEVVVRFRIDNDPSINLLLESISVNGHQ